MKQLVIPVEVETLQEGGFFAVCPLIHGCHAVGNSLPEALDNLADVAQVLLELLKEDGQPIPEGLRVASADLPLHGEILVTLNA